MDEAKTKTPLSKCERCGSESKEPICDRCVATKGFKKDGGKPRPSLMGIHAIAGLSDVLAYGAKKYSDDNWRHGMAWRRVADALLRHMLSWLGGEDRDPETGFLHMDHVLCNAMFLSEYQHTATGVDDRYKGASDGSSSSATRAVVG